MNTTGKPRMLAVSSIVSRVVPGMGETMARSWPSNWLSRLDLPALGRPMMAARMPRRRICPSLAVRSNSSMNATPLLQPGHELLPRVRRDVLLGEINVRLHVRQSLEHFVAQLVDALGQLAGELLVGGRKASSVREWIRSATASACARSMRPLRKARRVNSPGSARRAPLSSTVSSTALAGSSPPWQVISTTSSRVKVRGARITASSTSSTFRPPRTTWP